MPRSSLTPEQRSLRAALASYVSWAATPDPTARTEAARRAANSRFLDQVDPERLLPEPDRVRRAEHARKAHFLRLALKSSQARRNNRAPA